MTKLKVGYSPLSKNLSSPGDRRRLIYWAKARGHTLITDLNEKLDIIVASENSDFNSPIFSQRKVPIIFDLVDAYLSPLNPLDDLARGVAKKMSGQISGGIKPFSYHVRDFCKNVNSVICSSIEQEFEVKKFQDQTHVILDSHDEIPLLTPGTNNDQRSKEFRLLWEGQPATIRGVKSIVSALSKLQESNNLDLGLDFVTDESYFLFLNKYFRKETCKLLDPELRYVSRDMYLVPWSIENLVSKAKLATVGIIPIDLTIPMQKLKPENRLLIMWRLGIPCLTSPSPAYIRVAKQACTDTVCSNPNEWFDKLNQLLHSSKFSLNEVSKGQQYLAENHTSKILLHKWDAAVESAMSQR